MDERRILPFEHTSHSNSGFFISISRLSFARSQLFARARTRFVEGKFLESFLESTFSIFTFRDSMDFSNYPVSVIS